MSDKGRGLLKRRYADLSSGSVVPMPGAAQGQGAPEPHWGDFLKDYFGQHNPVKDVEKAMSEPEQMLQALDGVPAGHGIGMVGAGIAGLAGHMMRLAGRGNKVSDYLMSYGLMPAGGYMLGDVIGDAGEEALTGMDKDQIATARRLRQYNRDRQG